MDHKCPFSQTFSPMPLEDVQYKLRLPGQLHADLAAVAKLNGRSLSAEIIKRLEASLGEQQQMYDFLKATILKTAQELVDERRAKK
jgi:predicted HicB family RNase H-like nuclease